MTTRQDNVNMVHSTGEQLWLDFEPTKIRLLAADDIFDKADEALLKALDEDSRIERKPSSYSGSALGDYFSMWANTCPEGGLIVLGQSDDGKFEGCESLTAEGLN